METVQHGLPEMAADPHYTVEPCDFGSGEIHVVANWRTVRGMRIALAMQTFPPGCEAEAQEACDALNDAALEAINAELANLGEQHALEARCAFVECPQCDGIGGEFFDEGDGRGPCGHGCYRCAGSGKVPRNDP